MSCISYQQALGKAWFISFSRGFTSEWTAVKGAMFIVSALQAITEEQVVKLNELGIVGAAIGKSPKIDDEGNMR